MKKIKEWTYEDLKTNNMMVVLHNPKEINDFIDILNENNANTVPYTEKYTHRNWCAAMVESGNMALFVREHGLQCAKKAGFTIVNMEGYKPKDKSKENRDEHPTHSYGEQLFCESPMSIRIDVTKNETVVRARTDDGFFNVCNVAKKSPNDRFNAYIGARLALDRLFGLNPTYEDVKRTWDKF